MQRLILTTVGVGIVFSAAALGFGSATHEPTAPLTRDGLDRTLAHVTADADSAMASCALQAAATREMCRAEAQAKELIQASEAELNFRRNAEAGRAAQRAKIEARYLVERARCAALKGGNNDSCLIAVHAMRGRALLEAATPYRELASN